MSLKRTYLSFAEDVAKQATCPRASCGAVIVKDGTVLGIGWNGAAIGEPTCTAEGCKIEAEHCVRVIHAEVRALMAAARAGVSTFGAHAFLSQRPCQGCMSAMAEAGIQQVTYLHDYHSKKHSDKYCSPELMNLLRVTKFEDLG